MKIAKSYLFAAALAFALLLSVPYGWSQDGPPPPPPAGGPGAPPATSGSNAQASGADRAAQFRQRMAERLKTALKVNDEEWSVLQPLIEKVMTKPRDSFGGRGFGRRGPGGDQGSQANRPDRGTNPEADALRAALESESTSSADIKAKLEAVREARKKTNAELEQAREDLRKVLTQRQEATLVLMGILQ